MSWTLFVFPRHNAMSDWSTETFPHFPSVPRVRFLLLFPPPRSQTGRRSTTMSEWERTPAMNRGCLIICKTPLFLPLSSVDRPPRDHLFFATTTTLLYWSSCAYLSLIYTHNHPVLLLFVWHYHSFEASSATEILRCCSIHLSYRFPILAVEFSFMRKRKHKLDHDTRHFTHSLWLPSPMLLSLWGFNYDLSVCFYSSFFSPRKLHFSAMPYGSVRIFTFAMYVYFLLFA